VIVGAIAGISLGITTSRTSAFAQVTSDPSLGTVVTPNGTTFQITGGTTVGDTNLFHSFSSFSVPDGGIADFLNNSTLSNIFARVTGGSPSNIQGLIRSQGNTNLFLINPSGIIFGQNAQLNIGGSFVGTTANVIQFGNQGAFIASTSQNDVSLLTVNPSAFLFNQLAAQTITNQSVANPINPSIVGGNGLRVRDGKSLLLVGGNVNLEGGNLRVPGGRVELGGVAPNGTVGLFVDGNNLRLNFPDGVADVTLTNEAEVNVSGEGGGSIAINARNLNMAGVSRLQAGIAPDLGFLGSQAGNIEVNATENITLIGGSSIDNSVQFGATGRAGNVLITADTIAFDGNSRYFRASGAYSRILEGARGQGGNIEVKARSLQLTHGAVITTSTRGLGNAGSVTIIADTVSFDGQGDFNTVLGFKQSSAAFSAVTEVGEGQGGSVNVKARSLSLTNGGAIITSTLGQGDAGNIFINADTIFLSGKGSDSDVNNFFNSTGAYSSVLPTGEGQGGRIEIAARLLSLTNGAVITTSTSGQGDGGNIAIVDTDRLVVQSGAQVSANTSGVGRAGTLLVNASDSVEVSGTSANGRTPSRLNFDTSSAGDAGDLRINTPRLVVRDGGRVSARTSNRGRAGTLAVNAGLVEVSGAGSGLYFDSRSSGDAQGIRIETGQLVVRDGGQVTVNGTGSGNPGDLEVAAGSIFLNQEGKLTTETASGYGGNIRLQVQDEIRMRYQSEISASAQGIGNGGNVEIDIPNGFVLAFLPENSDIVASAIQGNGGVARATAAGVFGFRQFRGFRTPESDFTASSELGIDGRLEIITPDRRLEELPADFGDVEIAQGCEAIRAPEEQSRFVLTGRGGLPSNPQEALSDDAVEVDLVRRYSEEKRRVRPDSSTNSTGKAPTRLVEAQGWVMGNNGEVILTATAPTVTPHSSWQPTANCFVP
jgi:filamentous hemagglutinin family protein